MPATQSGFGNFFVDRSVAPAGYQMPVLGCAPPGVQPQQLAAMAGFPLAYSGLQGYNFIPYRPVTHMSNPYDLKAASPYHPALLARASPYYQTFRPGAAEDPSRVAKVATRESTGALKAWLNEHLKNPYPTKGEKIMLAIITKMSLTQVSTWFANARRRLKKENRVSWASKSKSDDEEEVEEEEEGESDVDEKSLLLDEEVNHVEVEEKRRCWWMLRSKILKKHLKRKTVVLVQMLRKKAKTMQLAKNPKSGLWRRQRRRKQCENRQWTRANGKALDRICFQKWAFVPAVCPTPEVL
ncbi:hypothetical protein WMY93_017721 [Mugilogobius chulae]|uniref:Homeobox domain-containing protein n=1 Tax=Mugilogobius chulae TaxID=88201 RepID=A0AAW0NTE5_9GOBI